MPRNALLEKLSEQWPTPLDAPEDKVRLSKDVAEILDAARPASLSKGRQLVHGTLKLVLIAWIVAENFHAAYAALGKLLGFDIPDGVCLRCGTQAVMVGTPSGKSVPNGGAR